jgi:Na+-transporting methylmalonyl-CoA/oxaloacetate decarboxylase gamma subunit
MVLGLALILFIIAALLLIVGVSVLVLAPVLATRTAAMTARPKLERRASGDERMRALITAQLQQRSRRQTLSTLLTRAGALLSGAAVLLFIGGLAAWLTGH